MRIALVEWRFSCPLLTVQAAEESGFTTLSVKAVKEVVSMGPRVSPCVLPRHCRAVR